MSHKKNKSFFLYFDDETKSVSLKKPHNYWHQIQGNLYITKKSKCDLFVWTPLDKMVICIDKDPSWASNIPILENFHRNVFLPSLFQ